VVTDWWRMQGSLKACEIVIIEHLEALRMARDGLNN
jgi:hypothetical protein